MSDADIDDLRKVKLAMARIVVYLRFGEERHREELEPRVVEAFEAMKRIEQRRQAELRSRDG